MLPPAPSFAPFQGITLTPTTQSGPGLIESAIVAAECDILHDDVVCYTDILRRADIPVEYHDFPGMRRPAIRAFDRKTERQPNCMADGTLPTPVSG